MAPAPKPVDQRKYQTGNHGYMKPGYTHQMVYPGTGKYLPLFPGNRALITHCQRNQNTGINMAGQCLKEMLPDFLPQTLDLIGRTINHLVQSRIPIVFPHVSAGSNVALESPLLEVKTMRIDTAMRTLEPSRDLPALACTDLWRCSFSHGTLSARAVPGKGNTRRNYCVFR